MPVPDLIDSQGRIYEGHQEGLFPGYPPARIVGVSYRFRSYLVAQGRIARTDFSGSQRHRMLRDRALRKTYARQVFYYGRSLPDGNSVRVVQAMRQRLHARPERG